MTQAHTPLPPGAHPVDPKLLRKRVVVTLAGAGGNGSKMLTGLGCLHQALKALGRPGLDVNVFDPDIVTRANVGRQMFSPADVGQYKALALVQRVNCFWGTAWKGFPIRYEGPDSHDQTPRTGWQTDVLITCVDTARARRTIHNAIAGRHDATPRYWLDLGNDKTFGQVILGEPVRHTEADVHKARGKVLGRGEKGAQEFAAAWQQSMRQRLPTIMDTTPELLAEDYAEVDTPSCSLAEALGKQDLFINSHVADWALHLLWTLLRQEYITHHGYYINLESGRVNPVPVPVRKAEAVTTKGGEAR